MRRDALHVLGVRGSAPVSDLTHARIGGNTSALAVITQTSVLLLDAGTGIDAFGRALVADRSLPRRVEVFLTHAHIDHILGLPRFAPCYDPDFEIRIHTGRPRHDTVRLAIERLFNPPLWPIPFHELPATIVFPELHEVWTQDDYRLTHAPLNHPGGATGYRLEGPKASVALITDHEHQPEGPSAGILALCHNAKHLFYDAQFTPDEYPAHQGWGHSTWAEGVALAQAAHAEHLWLYHHHPERTDDAMDTVVAEARRKFPNLDAAREGLVLPLA